jgi:hypothetical protein
MEKIENILNNILLIMNKNITTFNKIKQTKTKCLKKKSNTYKALVLKLHKTNKI